MHTYTYTYMYAYMCIYIGKIKSLLISKAYRLVSAKSECSCGSRILTMCKTLQIISIQIMMTWILFLSGCI